MTRGNAFFKDGEQWTITFVRRTIHLTDGKGLRYIAALLSRPGERVPCGELQRNGLAGNASGLLGPREISQENEQPSHREAERTRKAVTNRIREAISRIEAVHPELGNHLLGAVRTGTTCSYAPGVTVHWRLGAGDSSGRA